MVNWAISTAHMLEIPKRFLDKYKAFERGLLYLLPAMKIPYQKLQLNLEFGFSNRGSDLDNPVKMVQDILSKKYGFNDNLIFRIILDKVIVKKGDEYIKFEIIEHRDKNT